MAPPLKPLILKNSVFLFTRSVIVMLVGFYASRILLAKLGVEDYGVYNIVGSVVVLFGSVQPMFTNVIQRFLNYSKNGGIKQKNQIFNVSLRLQLILAGIFVVLTETVGFYAVCRLNLTEEQFGPALVVYQMTIASAVVSILTVPYDALIIANEKMKVFAWLSIINSIVRLGIIFLIASGPFDKLVNYSILFFLTACFIGLLTVGYCRLYFGESRLQKNSDKQMMKEMARFAGWNFLGFAGLNVMHQGVNYAINLSGGVIVNAARAIAYQVMGGVNTLVNNANTAFKPQTNAAAADEDKGNFYKLLGYNAKVSCVCYLLLVVPVLIFARQVIGIWLGQVPEYVVAFLLAISPYYLLRSLHQLVNQFFVSIGEMKYYQVIEFCAMMMIVPCAWLLLRNDYPFWTVFVCMTIIETVNHGMAVWLGVYKYGFPIKQFAKEVYLPFAMMTVVAVSLVASAYLTGITEDMGIARIGLYGMGVEIVMIVAVAFIVLTGQERMKILSYFGAPIIRKGERYSQ